MAYVSLAYASLVECLIAQNFSVLPASIVNFISYP